MNAEIKGVGLRGLLKYIKQNNPGGVEPLLEKLPPAERKIFESPILTSNWYPYSVFAELLKIMDDEMGSGDLKLCRKYAEQSASLDMNSIFKIFFKVGSPQFIIKRSDWFWKQYYRPGGMEVSEVTDTMVRIRVKDFNMVKHHCMIMEGWMEKALAMSGAKNPKMREVQCRSQGAPFCEFVGEWEK
jgi:hypothetical protein